MDISEYQRLAVETDQRPGDEGDALTMPLLGLAGEVGSLLVQFKKKIRDGDAHRLFDDELREEVGDVLWYLANIASKTGLDLAEAAQFNLDKTRDRWLGDTGPTYQLLDSAYPEEERLPRVFEVEIVEDSDDYQNPVVSLLINGERFGDPLRDNAHDEDGYRFHDVFHLSHAALLGWSPVVRSLLKRKRKSIPEVDDAEDGGRAIVIDEAIVALVFDQARRLDFFEGIDTVGYGLLRTVKQMTSGLEVSVRTMKQWEDAILAGYEVWRQIRDAGGGCVGVNLERRTIEVV